MSELRSLIALSMHKAGSSVLAAILQAFAAARGYEADIISRKVPASPLPEDAFFEAYQAQMRPQGVYYGMARGPYVARMPAIFRLRAVVQLRDPRDCITSLFFSLRSSHVPPEDPAKREAFLKRREALAAQDIDRFALAQAPLYRERMRILATIAEAHDDLLLLRYEEMVGDTARWLERIAGFLDQPLTPALRAGLGDSLDFSVAGEDAARHKRQVTPGDHRRKLRPETVAAMNAVLAEELARFGYAA